VQNITWLALDFWAMALNPVQDYIWGNLKKSVGSIMVVLAFSAKS